MRMRLRQVVMATADLAAAEREIIDQLDLELCYRDPGVATFGVRNALFPIGDQFLELVSPTRDGTAAGRQLSRRGGDCGYMVMLEVDDLDALRDRFDRLGARIVYEAVADGIVGLHLHPSDVGGAILSVDRTTTWGEWPWAGPVWRDHVRTDVVESVESVLIAAAEPARTARRWGELLGCDVLDDAIALGEGGEIRFVAAEGAGQGVCGFRLRVSHPRRARRSTICGCSFELVTS